MKPYLTLFLLFIVSWGEVCQAQSSPLDSLVLLKNTNVLIGEVQANFDKTIVTTASGSRLILATNDIGTICATYQDAFDFLRAQTPADDFEGQVRLFSWCLRNRQTKLAQDLIDQLQFSKIAPAQLAAMNQQLMVAVEQEQSAIKAKLATLPKPIPSTSKSTSNSAPEMNVDNQVHPASFETIPTVEARRESTQPVYELERAFKHVPDFGQASYKRVIEPILIKNCATAGCHTPNSESMPLFNAGRGVGLPKRMSQQNLYQVMRAIGDGTEDGSPLLSAGRTAHGTSTKNPIDVNSPEYTLLAEWATLMSDPVSASGVEPIEFEPEEKLPGLVVTQLPSERQSTPNSGIGPSATTLSPKTPGTIIEPGSLPTIPKLNKSKRDEVTSDPFDPETFNRKNAGGK